MMPIQNIKAGKPSASNKIIRLAFTDNHYMAVMPISKEDSDLTNIRSMKQDAILCWSDHFNMA